MSQPNGVVGRLLNAFGNATQPQDRAEAEPPHDGQDKESSEEETRMPGEASQANVLTYKGLYFRTYKSKAVVVGAEAGETDLKIPRKVAGKQVTTIGIDAFRGNEAIRTVSVPQSVVTLGSNAFRDCKSLEAVELPSDLEVINQSAFEDCVSLRVVHLPYSLRRLGRRAFAGCRSLTSLPHFVKVGPKSESKVVRTIVESSLPVALTYIGESAFDGCESLERIVLPHRVVRLNRRVFAECASLESVWLHSGLTSIGDHAFSGCTSLTELRVPQTTAEFGNEVFPLSMTIVTEEGSESALYGARNGIRVRQLVAPCVQVRSGLGEDSEEFITPGDVLADPVLLRELLDYYEVRPPMDESDRGGSPAHETTKPGRFEYLDGVYRSRGVGSGGDEVTISMVGDLMCGFRQQRQSISERGYDFRSSFRHVRSILGQSDLALGNLESMFADSYSYMGERLYSDDRPNLNAPHEYLLALRDAGFDAVSGAQNHMYDTGVKGIFQTLDSMNRAGLIHGGIYADKNEARHMMFEIKGIRVAVVAYLDPARQRMKQINFTAEGLSATASLFDAGCVNRDIARARDEGAEFVIAYAHWGTEYTDRISRTQTAFAEMLVAGGADYIFGSHSHCPQGYTVLQSEDGREVPVVFSGGNFLSDIQRRKPITQDTFISTLTLERDLEGKVQLKSDGYIPCRIVDGDSVENAVAVVPCDQLRHGLLGYDPGSVDEDIRRIRLVLGDGYRQLTSSGDLADEGASLAAEPGNRADAYATESTPAVREDGSNDFGRSPLTLLKKEPLESALLESEALACGLTVTRFTSTLFTASDQDETSLGFRRAASTLSSMVGAEVCSDKAVSKAILRANGIPTAVGLRMPRRGITSAQRFVDQHGWPVVVKPVKGSGGRGVTANIEDRDQLLLAIKEADTPRGFLIEKHVPGEDYRFLVVGDEVMGVWRRDAANVVGDGESTISSLIDEKNQIRSRNPHLVSRLIKKETLVENHLARSGRSLESVPGVGEKVYLRSAANLSSGGDNIEITDETHESLKSVAVRAKELLPAIELVGIDILMEDHRLSVDEQAVNICEINCSPGISAHDFPMFGRPRGVARQYLREVASVSGVTLYPRRDFGEFELSVRGEFLGQGYEGYLREISQRVGVELLKVDVGADLAVCRLRGAPAAVAVLDCFALEIRPVDGRAESTVLRAIESAE